MCGLYFAGLFRILMKIGIYALFSLWVSLNGDKLMSVSDANARVRMDDDTAIFF